MEVGNAYGGGKAGAPFDPIRFAQRPQVILRALCWLFAIVVFGCISSQGWNCEAKKCLCLYNEDANACNYGTGIGVIAFLASIGLLVGEYLFEQMSSVKTRKHYVLLDLGFSGLWAFLYFVAFCYLTNQWSNSKTPKGSVGVDNVQAAIAFSFFSIFTWAGCAFLAFQRFRQGTESAFAPPYEADAGMGGGTLPGGGAAYSSYPGGPDEGGYQEPPFNSNQAPQQQQQPGGGDFQAPAY